MKTILISRKSCVIEGFLHEARYVEELEILRTFQDEQEAYDMVGRQEVDLAIIDLDMEKSDGADIGWKLKKKNPDILLIYQKGKERGFMPEHLDILMFLWMESLSCLKVPKQRSFWRF